MSENAMPMTLAKISVACLLFLPIQLKAVIVEPIVVKKVHMMVNDQQVFVAKEEVLPVVWGDRIKILGAELSDRSRQAEVLNLVGFRARPRFADDRGQWVRTEQDLNREWSHDKSGRLFRVNIRDKSNFFGRVYIKLEQPQLEYVDLEINQKKRRVRVGELVELKAEDQLKVLQVKTNFTSNDRSLSYQVTNRDKTQPMSLTFFRHGKSFAAIQLRLSGS